MQPEINIHYVAEKIYMDLLVEIGRAGLDKKIYLVFSKKKKPYRFIVIREGDSDGRDEQIGGESYDLIGTYRGADGYPFYSDVIEAINAYVEEETSKEYGHRPELQKLSSKG